MTRKGPAKWARTMSRRLSGRNTRPKMAPQVEGKACRTKKPLKKDFRNFSLSHLSAFPNHEIGLVLPQVIEWAFASEPRSGGLQWTACSRNIGKTLRSPELLQHSLYKFSKPPFFTILKMDSLRIVTQEEQIPGWMSTDYAEQGSSAELSPSGKTL